METGKLIEMGEIETKDLDNTTHRFPMALLVTFDSVESIRQAIKDGCCAFKFCDG